MVRHATIHRNPKLYEEFFCNQAGNGLPIFVGGRHKKGHGLGSFFSGLGRMVLPWLKTGGKALLREGVTSGLQVAQDALGGVNIRDSMRDRAKEASQRLLAGAVDHVTQSGSGIRRRKRPAPPGEPCRKRIKPAAKRQRAHSKQNKTRDIFE